MTGLRKLALAFACATSVFQSTATNFDDKILDMRDCREKGFDPLRLACPTCDLLPEQFQKDCRNCCQSYLGAKRRTNPYQAAVLVQATFSQQHRFPTELDMLLEDRDEWDQILQEKGGARRLQILTRQVPPPESNLLSLYNMKYRPPIEVLLLDETLPAEKQLSYEKLKEKATEIISLQGLSKDDMKDLLRTLLP